MFLVMLQSPRSDRDFAEVVGLYGERDTAENAVKRLSEGADPGNEKGLYELFDIVEVHIGQDYADIEGLKRTVEEL
ncbi:hypothetical protein AGMMS49944_03880 [Spirochaetia bacterium]|nr:hypothetical protein AGMMS49944_03880 [Spirochaetia bacterium]